MLPVNFARIMETGKNSNYGKTTLKPEYVMGKLKSILSSSITSLICMSNSQKLDPKSIKFKDEQKAKLSFKGAIYENLSPKRCIKEYKLTKEVFDDIIEDIINSYNKNIIEPGEMVGIIAAESEGECLTQMTLNAFHQAGTAVVANMGVPRLKEILNLSKNIKTPFMEIYLTNDLKYNKEMATKIASYIKYTTIGDLITQMDVYYEPHPQRKGGFMEQDNIKNIFHGIVDKKSSCSNKIDNLPWLLRIEIDREKLLNEEVTLLDIKSTFCNTWENRSKTQKKEEKVILDKIISYAILSNSEDDVKPIIHIRFDMTNFDISIVHGFMNLLSNYFKLKGVSNILNHVDVTEERYVAFDNDNKANPTNQFKIIAEGTNLFDIRYINGIDIYNTICNDLISIYETFGIEACRSYIIKEIQTIYASSSNVVNYHHISLLADMMCFNGFLVSIDRHGMSKSDAEPLTRASFEKSVHQLISASVFGEVDTMKGVSSRIMAGLVIRGGTGYCNIYLDDEIVKNSEYTGIVGDSESILTKDALMEDIMQ
jgi:DNA-directed RNA polymerase II subunit RPB1